MDWNLHKPPLIHIPRKRVGVVRQRHAKAGGSSPRMRMRPKSDGSTRPSEPNSIAGLIQWIGLRENLQETMVFTIKYSVFL